MTDKVKELLKESGAVLIRKKHHEVWRLPNGKNFVRGQSPSDRRAELNSLADLRKLLGIRREVVKSDKPKVAKSTHKKHELPQHNAPVNRDLADKLKVVGVSESSLREQIEHQRAQMKILREAFNDVVDAYSHRCVFCRLREWAASFWKEKNQ